MQKITPFLWFDNGAEEAMNLYVEIFNSAPGSTGDSKILNIMYYPEGIEEEHMKGMEGKVLTGVFELRGQKFMALDGGPVFKPNESVSFLVDCETQEEIDYFWDKLIAGGGAESQCGWLKDKYGFSWQIVPDMNMFFNQPDKAKANRAVQAMLKMKKIIIKDLEEA